MATMIPEKPHHFESASQEGLMFEALEMLPDEYYVFHSFRISEVSDNVFHESETDFVIYNRVKGVICLEAKAGAVRYEKGSWLYGNGIPMHNGGPFNQASSNKWKLIKYIESYRSIQILDHCKFLHAVWFPSISNAQLRTMKLPSEGDRVLVLTQEALSDPKPYIDRIFDIELPNRIETSIAPHESQRFLREVLCPQFNVFPSASFDADLKKIIFHRMLQEQAGILNFLDEQRTAVINGAAGTGKTMIALEKAQRHGNRGEQVLFLCYNVQLKDFIAANYPNEHVDYYTVSGLACKLCNTTVADFSKLKAKLEDMYLSESFPYTHVIIDEGQDFGQDNIEEANILQVIKDIVSDRNDNSTFYIFYDQLQLIQGNMIPKYIAEADCKLTLYRNCRNTENIAVTSLRPISEREPKLFDRSVKGTPAKFHFCETEQTAIAKIDSILDNLRSEGFNDIVLLTCKTEETSLLSPIIKDGRYRKSYKFTTCRKFKGLEADAVILIDVNGDTFNSENVMVYYVGTSRARIKLDIVTTLTDEECTDILINRLGASGKIKRPKRDLASALNAIGSIS